MNKLLPLSLGIMLLSSQNQKKKAETLDANKNTKPNIVYILADDLGENWTNIEGTTLQIPLLQPENPARIIDYQSQAKNVYMKDLGFDSNGNPACLYIRVTATNPGRKVRLMNGASPDGTEKHGIPRSSPSRITNTTWAVCSFQKMNGKW